MLWLDADCFKGCYTSLAMEEGMVSLLGITGQANASHGMIRMKVLNGDMSISRN